MGIVIAALAALAAGVLWTTAAAADTSPSPSSLPSPLALYGEEMHFEVRRDGQAAGEHRVQFSGDNAALTVAVQTRATMTFFGLFDVPFIYDSRALWNDGVLQTLRASHKNFGDARHTMAARVGDIYVVDGRLTVASPLFSTNHWNMAALAQQQLHNTLNGKITNINPRALATEMVEVGDGVVSAQRYHYGDDLDVDVWYDAEGRWVKLSFSTFGTRYEFICRHCGVVVP